MSFNDEDFDQSLKDEICLKANKLRISLKEAKSKQIAQVERLLNDGLIDESNKKILVCSIKSAEETILTLIEMLEKTNISTDLELKKYVVAISDAMCSFYTGITEEINITIENASNSNSII